MTVRACEQDEIAESDDPIHIQIESGIGRFKPSDRSTEGLRELHEISEIHAAAVVEIRTGGRAGLQEQLPYIRYPA